MNINMNINNDSDSGGKISCVVCKKCQEKKIKGAGDSDEVGPGTSSLTAENKCASWLEQCTISGTASAVYETSSASSCTTESKYSSVDEVSVTDVSQIIGGLKDCIKPNHFENIRMINPKNPFLGTLTKIYGDVIITQTESVVTQQTVTNQLFLTPPTAIPRKLFILDRRSWLAQPALEEKEFLEIPAKYVIICHTATEEGLNQYENIDLVKTIQTYHIESRKWNDIAYNFLIGSDSNIYEGRGWGVVGAHTFGYNNISLGLGFIGCFMNKLPPQTALTQTKALIKHGVENGYIDREYRLVSHCQCRPFESPGKQLYEEIKTWDNWYDLEALESV